MSYHSISAAEALNKVILDEGVVYDYEEFKVEDIDPDVIIDDDDDFSESLNSLEDDVTTPEITESDSSPSRSDSDESSIPAARHLSRKERKKLYRVRREVTEFMENLNKPPEPRPYDFEDLEMILYTCRQIIDFIRVEACHDLTDLAVCQICNLVDRMDIYCQKIGQGRSDLDSVLM